ncbi:hypothetical protein MPAR168_23455 [Methylorubrum populi]|uniref:DUF6894 domain-containing protein n=1 Tax=Methylobacterium radiotolerans TaxID=31998 RepID=A0ABU7TGW2_9HYPH
MPRYFFDVEDGESTTDEEGTVLTGRDQVAAEAMKTMLEIAAFEATVKDERGLSVTARDEAGRKVYRTSLTIRAEWL